eukprot:CAMPEP_0174254724 /NCGR_PEP_ID=MMETSP0439-20130205/4048_1 /TAXON_ID=0 /ORGANISM="Stereomyxa ramosa, Strain Chinc5" /LENGTH=526 /DNA_ID=CAMNT_0015336491 /DNA_START=186 /DNA_END=1766 /DNA_ORIENTATION=+
MTAVGEITQMLVGLCQQLETANEKIRDLNSRVDVIELPDFPEAHHHSSHFFPETHILEKVEKQVKKATSSSAGERRTFYKSRLEKEREKDKLKDADNKKKYLPKTTRPKAQVGKKSRRLSVNTTKSDGMVVSAPLALATDKPDRSARYQSAEDLPVERQVVLRSSTSNPEQEKQEGEVQLQSGDSRRLPPSSFPIQASDFDLNSPSSILGGPTSPPDSSSKSKKPLPSLPIGRPRNPIPKNELKKIKSLPYFTPRENETKDKLTEEIELLKANIAERQTKQLVESSRLLAIVSAKSKITKEIVQGKTQEQTIKDLTLELAQNKMNMMEALVQNAKKTEEISLQDRKLKDLEEAIVKLGGKIPEELERYEFKKHTSKHYDDRYIDLSKNSIPPKGTPSVSQPQLFKSSRGVMVPATPTSDKANELLGLGSHDSTDMSTLRKKRAPDTPTTKREQDKEIKKYMKDREKQIKRLEKAQKKIQEDIERQRQIDLEIKSRQQLDELLSAKSQNTAVDNQNAKFAKLLGIDG